ncbi:hypothetical protein Pmani_025931 [Petrolisthes manimaculis]|uniref:Uncharacterized protein n=1 Tax=Petrolisthes manimaculis TaxID=1843537 RepID=A0AAE1U0N1_9EUCA|nr:hypothetical protein Pmani_025931 [Petrolisthes manimaculis]
MRVTSIFLSPSSILQLIPDSPSLLPRPHSASPKANLIHISALSSYLIPILPRPHSTSVSLHAPRPHSTSSPFYLVPILPRPHSTSSSFYLILILPHPHSTSFSFFLNRACLT